MSEGKLFVICGIDGSGKTTQTKRLVERLRQEGYKVETTDFPRYGNPSAYFVEKYLNGGYGGVGEVTPYTASLFYALDRYDAGFAMKKILEEGTHIVSNRYVSASQGHQAGKIRNSEERKKFVHWLEELEFGICGIPRPTLNIFLFMPPDWSQKNVEKKTENREYLKSGKTKDIHEENTEHLRHSTEAYLEAVNTSNDWIKIDGVDAAGELRDENLIAEEIWQAVQKHITNTE